MCTLAREFVHDIYACYNSLLRTVLATATVLLAWPGGRLRLNNRDPDGPGAKTTYPVADAGSNAPRACGSPFIHTHPLAAIHGHVT